MTSPATTGTTGIQVAFPALESVDDSGVVTDTAITVVGPWGDEVETSTGAAGSFTPEFPGIYTLVYSATDAAGNENSVRYAVAITRRSTASSLVSPVRRSR